LFTDRQTEGQTHGPMAETWDLGSKDLKVPKTDHRKFDPITLLSFLYRIDKESKKGEEKKNERKKSGRRERESGIETWEEIRNKEEKEREKEP
jgi:hypothetical protein